MRILVVEDNENDALFMTMSLEEAGVDRSEVDRVADGREALAYLAGVGKYSDRKRHPIPYLVFLDLKLPLVMGLEVLRWARGRAEFASTIFIALSSSGDKKDIEAAYRLGARAYLIKPSRLKGLQEMAKAVKEFWLVHNRPARGSARVLKQLKGNANRGEAGRNQITTENAENTERRRNRNRIITPNDTDGEAR